MASFAKGDIVLFPFPYTNLSERKLRPCLVISDEMKQDIVLCQITSRYTASDRFCVTLSDNKLMMDSLIRTNMLFTCRKNQILKKLSKVNKSIYKEVVHKIVKLIDTHPDGSYASSKLSQ
ncbi:type II toxin-antitoxin system PemK/MazF family toxin [Candidatus Woesearchaeota archaeon]|nr:type II toxin-antitoxin system PemK/MazF family toxin [Candidatus Woesearchaeota archaeon]